MRARGFIVAAILGAAALTAWLVMGGGGRSSGGAGDPDAGADGRPPGAAAGTGPEGAATGAVPGLRGRAEEAGGAGEGETETGGGSIVGVVLKDGAPIAATVEARKWRGRKGTSLAWNPLADLAEACDLDVWAPKTLRTVHSGADGRFAIENLPAGRYEVAGIASDGLEGTTGMWLRGDHREEVRILVPAEGGTASLAGRVLLTGGRPWRGTIGVRASNRRNSACQPRRLVETDGDGRFLADRLNPGWVEVHAFDGERHAAAGPVRVPYEGEWTWSLDEGTVEVSGRVLAAESGGGIGGAVVNGGGSGQPGALATEGHGRATTAPDGSFKLRVLPRDARLVAEAPGYAPSGAWVEGAEVPVEIRLSKTSRLFGRVTADPGGGPAAGAVVYVVAGDPYGRDTFTSSAVADGEGKYAVDGLPPRDVAALVRGGGWIGKGADRLGIAGGRVTLPAGGTATLDLVASKGARAAGIVVDAAGAPLAAVRLALEENVNVVDGVLNGGVAVARSARTPVTGVDGRFAVGDLHPGSRCRVTAYPPGSLSVPSDWFRASLDAPADLRIVVPAARWLTVTLVEKETRKPVPRANVWVYGTFKGNGFNATGPPTDANGVMRAGPLPGGEALDVNPYASTTDGLSGGGGKIAFAAGQSEATATVEMWRGLEIAGRLVFPDGVLPVDVSVEARKDSDSRTDFAFAPDGAFRFTALGPGTWKLTAAARRPEGTLRGSVEAEAGAKDARLALAKTEAALVVRLVDAEGRTPPIATVALAGKSRTRTFNNTYSVDGTLVLDADPALADLDELKATAFNAQRRDGSPLPLGVATVTVPREAKEVTIVLPPERAIAGRVVSPDGRGVAWAMVTSTSIDDTGRNLPTWSNAWSGVDGTFRLGRLSEGRVRVCVQPPEPWLAGDCVFASAGDSDVLLTVKTSANATVCVVDADGKPVQSAYVVVQGPGGQSLNTDEFGIATLYRLPVDAPFVLTVNANRRDLVPFRRESWTPRDETVRLERACSVSGFVRDLAGEPVMGAIVTTANQMRWTDARGAFTIDGVPPGDARIRVRLPADEDSVARAEGLVPAGARDLVFAIDAGLALEVRVEGVPPGVAGQGLLLPRGPGDRQRSIAGAWTDLLRFRGLASGQKFALYLNCGGLGSTYVEPVDVGDSPLVVRLSPAVPIAVAVRMPAGARVESVYADLGGYRVGGSAPQDGSGLWRIPTLPDGRWNVRVLGRSQEGKVLEGWAVSRRAAADVDLLEQQR